MILARETNLTVREARALIRYRVRNRLTQYDARDIWQTAFFIERLDLAVEAFDCQHAQYPNGTAVEIGTLIGFAKDEFADFVMLQDQGAQVTLSPQGECVRCESCSQSFELASCVECPCCHHTSLYQRAGHELADLRTKLQIEVHDPIKRRILAEMQEWQLQTACTRFVACFEAFYKGLDLLAFKRECRPQEKPNRPNLFQNIRDTQTWFWDHHKVDILDGMQQGQITTMKVLINKRHVLSHNGGIVDSQYIDRTGDTSQTEGQPLKLTVTEILEAIRLLEQRVQFARTQSS